ncbi:MAG: alpha/beta hydrolase [Gammaproteobacteria bacterium]|nr:alpha/beta hydrolase [Gammaproteobacteria bacterium]
MKILKWSLLLAIILSSQAKANECVILLHGLVRSESSLTKLESVLKTEGYFTVNYDYPSTRYNIENLADLAITDALSQCPNTSKINFVTHSLGGILVRQYLSTKEIPNLGRVVMLGPPNQGSEVVDRLKNVPGYELINGPAGMQLGTGKMSVPRNLGSANFDLGIIAGTRSINLILSTLLPNPDDGKVSVENTKIEGMNDHISLPVAHPFIMKNDKVIYQVVHYLKHGKFKRRK